MAKFTASDADVVYGDLWYIDRENINKVVRKWKSRRYQQGFFQSGWMPAHPTFYGRRELFEKYGTYDLSYGSAADYELMLRFIHKHRVKAEYLDRVMIKMRVGGISIIRMLIVLKLS